MSAWAISSITIPNSMTEHQQEIIDALRKNGRVTVSFLSEYLGRNITGALMSTIQVKVLEAGRERVTRNRVGRNIFWEIKSR